MSASKVQSSFMRLQRQLEKPGSWLPVLLASLWLVLFWGEWLFHAGSSMLTQGGVDGIKNYYALSWYLEHNESWTQFEGMNHPNGDLVVFTDGHPLLAWLLRCVGIGGCAAVGVLNLLILLSILPATWFTSRILQAENISPVPAAFLALLVVVVLPQWERLGGHFSLSHMWVIPLLVWLLYKTLQSAPSARRNALFALASLALYFTHPYLGLMASGLALGVGFWSVLLTTTQKNKWLGFALGAGILPILIFQGWIWVFDTHLNRPTDPSGFWQNHSHIAALLTPQHGPLARLLQGVFNGGNIRWEVRAYIGFAALALGVVRATLFIRERKVSVDPTNAAMNVLLGSTSLLALFSLGWIFQAFPALVDWFSPVKNFRVLGRFAWPWVYFVNLALLGWAWKQSFASKLSRNVLLAVLLLGFWEAGEWHWALGRESIKTANKFSEPLGEAMQDVIEFAAQHGCTSILPLPYFHKGSEFWDTPADELLVEQTMMASFHSGLPMLSSIMSRTSIEETRTHLSWRSPFPYEKNGLHALEVEGNLLVAMRKDLLSPQEGWLHDQCKERMDANGCTWGVLSPHFLRNQPLLETGIPMVSATSSSVKKKWYNGPPSGAIEEYTTLWSFAPGELNIGEEVECSFWFEQQERKRPTEAFFVVVKGANGDSWQAFNTINRSCHFSGDSIRFSARFTPLNPEAEHRFVVKRPKNDLNNVALHHAMLRPTSVNVVDSLKDGFYRVNNHIPSSTVLPSSP